MSEASESIPIPYSVTFEGRIAPERLPELITMLGDISTEQSISFQIGDQSQDRNGEPQEIEVSKDEYRAVNLNNTAGGQGWAKLRRASEEYEDFPLRFGLSEDGNAPWFQGNIDQAIAWLHRNPLKGPGSASALAALKKLRDNSSFKQK